jgi:hypothetical protein
LELFSVRELQRDAGALDGIENRCEHNDADPPATTQFGFRLGCGRSWEFCSTPQSLIATSRITSKVISIASEASQSRDEVIAFSKAGARLAHRRTDNAALCGALPDPGGQPWFSGH